MADETLNISILPKSSTRLERDVEKTVMSMFDKLMGAAKTIKGIKYNDIPDSFIPWLIKEYNLGEIAAIFDDPKIVLEKGLPWSRIKGTEKALTDVLEWLGVGVLKVESDGPGDNFAYFQIELDKVPDGPDIIKKILKAVKLSAPVRSKLKRVYSGYNVPIFTLNKTKLNKGLLNGFSGVYNQEYGVWLSFRRYFAFLNLDFNINSSLDVSGQLTRKRTFGVKMLLPIMKVHGSSLGAMSYNSYSVDTTRRRKWDGSWDGQKWDNTDVGIN